MSRVLLVSCGLAVLLMVAIRIIHPMAVTTSAMPYDARPSPDGQTAIAVPTARNPSMVREDSRSAPPIPSRVGATARESTREDARVQELRAYDIDPVRGNALLNELLRESPGLEAVLIDITHDPGYSERWHDFVIQHLANLYELRQTDAVRETLEWAAVHGNGSQQEVAVYSLARIADSLQLTDESPLVRALHRRINGIFSGSERDDLVDTAFRAVALLNDPRHVGKALEVIHSARTSPQVRVSALDYLAQVRPGYALASLERFLAKRPAGSSNQIDVAARRAVTAIRGGK